MLSWMVIRLQFLYFFLLWGSAPLSVHFPMDYMDSAITASANPDPEPLGDFEQITLPLRRVGNLMVIEVEIDGQVGNFILDIGAPYLVLNKTYFRGYLPSDTRSMGGINGEGERVRKTEVGHLQIRDLYFEEISADVVSLAALENEKGIKILGLLGLNLFKKLDIELDLKANILHLFRLDEHGIRLAPFMEDEDHGFELSCPLRIEENIAFVEATIGGQKLQFCLDTGAEINVLSSKLPSEVTREFTIKGRVWLRGSEGRRTEALTGFVRNFKIGDQNIPRMRMMISNLDHLEALYGQRVDGVLGFDFLASGKVCLNFKSGEICIFGY